VVNGHAPHLKEVCPSLSTLSLQRYPLQLRLSYGWYWQVPSVPRRKLRKVTNRWNNEDQISFRRSSLGLFSVLTFFFAIFAFKSHWTDTFTVVVSIAMTMYAFSAVFAYNPITDTFDYNTRFIHLLKIEFLVSRSNLSHERPLKPLGQWQSCVDGSWTPSFIQKWAIPGSCVLVDIVGATVVTAVTLPTSDSVIFLLKQRIQFVKNA
jgi:hypothetical protein